MKQESPSIGLSYEDRERRAHSVGKRCDRVFRAECDVLGLDPKTAVLSPLDHIAARRARNDMLAGELPPPVREDGGTP